MENKSEIFLYEFLSLIITENFDKVDADLNFYNKISILAEENINFKRELMRQTIRKFLNKWLNEEGTIDPDKINSEEILIEALNCQEACLSYCKDKCLTYLEILIDSYDESFSRPKEIHKKIHK